LHKKNGLIDVKPANAMLQLPQKKKEMLLPKGKKERLMYVTKLLVEGHLMGQVYAIPQE